jgi:hypothetical protein
MWLCSCCDRLVVGCITRSAKRKEAQATRNAKARAILFKVEEFTPQVDHTIS